MRNISIDLSKGNINMPIFCGYDGEHKETTLTITLPKDMIASNSNYIYKILYCTSTGEQIEDNDYHSINNEGKVVCVLYQQMMKVGILRLQVVAYKQSENDTSTVDIIAKSQMIPLLVKESVTGETTDAIVGVSEDETYWATAMNQIQEVSAQISGAEATIVDLNAATESANRAFGDLVAQNNDAIRTIDTLQNILNAADADRRMNLIKQHLDSDANSESDFEYSIKSNDTICIMSYIGTETDVIIPHIINNRVVTDINSNAFDTKGLTSVLIPNTVISISQRAFADNRNLNTVKFEDNSNLQQLDNYAFISCTALYEVELPSSLTRIGNSAFRGCSNLSTVIAEDTSNITSWGTNIFEGCSSELTLYEGEGLVLFNEAMHWGYSSRKFVCNKLLSDILHDIMVCTSPNDIPTAVSNHLSMEGLA